MKMSFNLLVRSITAFLSLGLLQVGNGMLHAQCDSPPAGLVAWWPAEGNANDVVGGNNGTLHGGMTFTNGEVGQAFQLDHATSYITVPASTSLDIGAGAGLTIECWIKPNAETVNVFGGPIIEWDSATLAGLQMWAGNNGAFFLGFNDTSGKPHVLESGGGLIVDTNQFYHLAGTYDKNSGLAVLYLDGINVASVNFGSYTPQSTSPLNIGRRTGDPVGNGDTFGGLIDELSLYNRALSSNEIAAIYNAGSAGKCKVIAADCVSPPVGLVGWWPGEGNASDIVGGNNGTLLDGVSFGGGEVGQAFLYGTTNAGVKVPASPALNVGLGNGLTIEGWINPASLATREYISEWNDGNTNQGVVPYGVQLFILGPGELGLGAGNLYGDVYGGGQSHEIAAPGGTIATNKFQHVALTYDKTSGIARLYCNGVVVAQQNLGSFTPLTSYDFYIGRRPDQDFRSFSGKIDELSLYNRALSSNEIAAIYSAGSAGKCKAIAADCVSPPTGLVGWWPGEGNASDIVGGNNGMLLDGVSFGGGEVGQAFLYGTTNAGVKVPASPALDVGLGNGLTVEGWINPASLATREYISEWNDGNTNQGVVPYGVQLFILQPGELGLGAGSLYGDMYGGGQSHEIAAPGGTIATNTFQHVALTYDKTSGVARLYCNGVVVAQQNLGSFTPLTSYDFYIGRRPDQDFRSFSGRIDELSLYSRALSSNEIAAIYSAGSAGKCSFTLPRGATASAVVVNGFVVGVTIINGGYGYTNTPLVRLIGGGGSGAQAFAVVSNGVVTSITVTNPGSGYTNAPVVFIEPPIIPNPVLGIAPMSFLAFSNLTVGGAYQLQQSLLWYWTNRPVTLTASNSVYTQMFAGVVGSGDYRLALYPLPAQAFAMPQVVNGFVVGATVTSGGSGYVASPAVSIVGGGGTNATAVSQVAGGVVTSVSITSPGIGYTNAPTVKIAPPPAGAVSPTVFPVMRVDASWLAPYENYQVQFKPDLGGAWVDWAGGLFSPTDVTNSQFLFITNDMGFFRLQFVP